jgi:PAS domain S-box-containing protein
MNRDSLRQTIVVLAVAVLYFGAAELGLSLASVHTNVSPVWPPSGIALSALLIFGVRLWPGIFIGALAANSFTNVPFATALGIAIGNTLEATLAVYLLRTTPHKRVTLNSVSEIARFVLFAVAFAPMVSATIGNISLCLGNAASWSDFAQLWLTWWLGDAFGVLILTPCFLSWGRNTAIPDRLGEISMMMILLFVTSMVIFGGWFPGPIKTYPLAYLCLPLLLWAALRFDQRIVTLGILLLAAVAVWGALNSYGPFVRPNPNTSQLLLLSFIGTATLTTLVLFAATNERRLAEQEGQRLGTQLEMHRRRIEDIVQTVPGVVWEAWGQPDEASQQINFVSSGVEKMLGYSKEEWLATPNFWLSIVHPDDKERAAQEAAGFFTSCTGGVSRFRWLRKDGREVWVEAQSVVVLDSSGAPVGMRGVTIDISAAIQAENERAELLRRERAARTEAEDASRLKDEFLATVSHELRTPLNAVVGWARLLRTGQLDSEGTSHALEVIERNAGVQRQIIEDLLDVSRIITGKLLVASEPLELLLVIHAAIDVIRPAAAAKDIQLQTHIDAPEVVVRGDADRLQQIIWNLLANAVKFTPAQGTVDIYLTQEGTDAEIRIEDSGPGIPDEFLSRVFDRFSQADSTSTRKHGGLGLGLAIVRHLVELHGGSVLARNKDTQGAILIVRLPAVERRAPELSVLQVKTTD